MGEKISVISSYDLVKNEINYGSLLQYYALQKFLECRGHNVEWIRFVYKKRGIKKIIDELAKLNEKGYVSKKICLSKFQKFIKTYLNVTSDECSSGEQIKMVCKNSSVFITGSDQVWGGAIEENFLTFAKKTQKKISYAASFGRKDIEEEMLNTISPWILDIDYISLREKSGVNICEQIGRTDAIVVPDPTILLEKSDYPIKDLHSKKTFIFSYFLNIKDELTVPYGIIGEYLEKICDDNLVSCIGSGTRFVPHIFEENRVYPSPEEWLGYYQDAKIIFTNSFHGTVFALIFRKPFVVFTQDGATSKQNERIYNLLSGFNLLDRIYSEKNDIDSILKKSIDWKHVSNIMGDQRRIAQCFFERINL